ncbi:HET-domain-containing protein [Massarina eburnea CBS 473.64]|uniref:HET-domain-containing protein n=1 Tax=Massarina eburnea CBS 473.64 TaxID=1395130 RepID=A0A6A6SKH9_9PLEO|nr:HET-domain-containing protein [Massarina eburnea CBS 473.64]
MFQSPEERLTSHRIKSLPRKFRDAINVTRQIGIRYIWIDALCIVQDPFED